MHAYWKDVLHHPVNDILTLQKNYILHLAKTLITDSTTEQKQYLKYVALRTVRYLQRLSTEGNTLLFTESVNSTNITVHIPQCVTVMNQDTLQHFPTGSTLKPLSHTRLHLTDGLV